MQHILVPILSAAYVQTLTGNFIRNQFKLMMDDVDKNKFERMDPMHHLLAGVKAKFTDDVVAAIDKCRRSTGGAGFASHSGLPDLYYNTSPTPTYEGDNIVMLLQASRYLLKLVKRSKETKELPFPFSYILKIDQLLSIKVKGSTVDELLDLNTL